MRVGDMSSGYVPKVGDRVRVGRGSQRHPHPSGAVVATHDRSAWVLWDDAEGPVTYDVSDLEPDPTFRERWMNVYDDGFVSHGHPSRDEADGHAARVVRPLRRIGVIHLHRDGRVEMEQP